MTFKFPPGILWRPKWPQAWNAQQSHHIVISHLQELGEHLEDRYGSSRWEGWEALSELWVPVATPAGPLNYGMPSNLGSPQLVLRSVLGWRTPQLVFSSGLCYCIQLDNSDGSGVWSNPERTVSGQWLQLGALWIPTSAQHSLCWSNQQESGKKVLLFWFPRLAPLGSSIKLLWTNFCHKAIISRRLKNVL